MFCYMQVLCAVEENVKSHVDYPVNHMTCPGQLLVWNRELVGLARLPVLLSSVCQYLP